MSSMTATFRLFLLAAVWFVPGAAASPPCDSWRVVQESSEGTLYHRCRPGSPFDEVMIETRFRAPPERLYALVNDYAGFAGFIPDVAESRVLAVEGPDQWVYHRLHLPGPVADRVYVMRSTAHVDGAPPVAWHVEWMLSDRVFTGIDFAAGIRPDSLSGSWEIEGDAVPKRSKARYAVHTDPGGQLPVWLVMRLTDRYVQRVVAAIRGRLEE